MPKLPISNLRRDRYLSWLTPFDQLDTIQRISISLWKDRFKEYDNDLRDCLNTLAVPQLEPYLAWVPPDDLREFKQLAEGGFAKVFSARIIASRSFHNVAAKELNDTMVSEVRSSHHYTLCIFQTTY